MKISYKKLWKLLIDRDLLNKDLIAMSGISQSSVTKLGHNDNVNTEVLVKICNKDCFDCLQGISRSALSYALSDGFPRCADKGLSNSLLQHYKR